MHLVYVVTFLGRSLASLQGDPVSQVRLWAPSPPGKREVDVTSQGGLELTKDTAFTGRKQIPLKTAVGDREVKLCAKDGERRQGSNCSGNADLKMFEGQEE